MICSTACTGVIASTGSIMGSCVATNILSSDCGAVVDWNHLDAERNAAHTTAREAPISTDASRVAVYVVPTNEELLIARDTVSMVSGTSQPSLTSRSLLVKND